MGLPIEIAGLRTIIDEIPDGNIVTIDGGIELSKAVLAMSFISTAISRKLPVTYVQPENGFGLMEQVQDWKVLLNKVGKVVKGLPELNGNDPSQTMLIDSISYILIGYSTIDFKKVMEDIRSYCRSTGSIAIILMESDLMSKETGMLAGFHSDGIIKFHSRDVPDGVTNFIRVVKWMTGLSYEKNIYYSLNEGRISIDLRYRVV